MTTSSEHCGVLVQLVFWCPAVELDQVVTFLRQLDERRLNWDVQMDSHPSDELVAQLPPRVRVLAASRQNDNLTEVLESLGRE